MNEAKWLACDDSYAMLEYLRGKASDRKLRLFAVACCLRPYYQVDDERHRNAVQLAERMADEDVSEAEWRTTHQAAKRLWEMTWAKSLAAQQEAPRGTPEVELLVHKDMATAAGWAVLEDAWEAAYQVTGVEWDEEHSDEPDQQLALLRDIIGNPFRPTIIDSDWLLRNQRAVAGLARSIYDGRAWHDLSILADAMMDAGCEQQEMIDHCRTAGPHVRGCWVVDLLLQKK